MIILALAPSCGGCTGKMGGVHLKWQKHITFSSIFPIRLTKAQKLTEQRNRAKVFGLYKFQHLWYDSTFLP